MTGPTIPTAARQITSGWLKEWWIGWARVRASCLGHPTVLEGHPALALERSALSPHEWLRPRVAEAHPVEQSTPQPARGAEVYSELTWRRGFARDHDTDQSLKALAGSWTTAANSTVTNGSSQKGASCSLVAPSSVMSVHGRPIRSQTWLPSRLPSLRESASTKTFSLRSTMSRLSAICSGARSHKPSWPTTPSALRKTLVAVRDPTICSANGPTVPWLRCRINPPTNSV